MKSLNDKLEAYLKARPNQWVTPRELAEVAGFAGWRTRLSNLRLERHMTIENEMFLKGHMKISRYRYVPAVGQLGLGL